LLHPVGAVAPRTVEEVQAIVLAANRHHQPLWPISTGKNMGYGSAVPATPGQVVLDL
jgi:4-cresol dehydrogenase (hydroxylating)